MVKAWICQLSVLLFVVLTGCSASKKAFKQAQEYEAAGLYVEAAEQDLRALQKDPNFKDALVHLKQVAPKAYDELLRRATNLEKANNWEQTVAEYEHLENLLRRFHTHGVVFQTVDVGRRLNTARQRAAEHQYAVAESQFKNKEWDEAAYSYLRAHRYVENYNGSFDRAIQSFLNAGNQLLSRKKYLSAIDTFAEILKMAPGHRTATQKVAESHYLLGRQYFDEERFRAALSEFEHTQEIVPEFKDVGEWIDRAYDRAVQYIAVFPFLNQSSVPVDGYLIASELTTRLQHANLEFVDLLPYPEMMMLVDEAGLIRSDALIEAEILQAARAEQLDSFVWGKVRHVTVEDEKPIFVEVVEDTEPIFFREYTQTRRVEVRVELLIIETENGRILQRDIFNDRLSDVAKWVAYQGSIYDLPKAKRPLLDAPRDPRPVPVLLDELLASMCNRMSREVVKFYR